jgi:long-subunit acyl-CoA synthetase (AMP-forming)
MGLTEQPSLAALFQATAARFTDRVALRTIDDTERLTWGHYAAEVARVARGLAGLGVGHGDTVAMLLSNRPAFHIADTAALHLGAAGLSIYGTLPPEDITWIMQDSGARVLITEAAALPRVRDAKLNQPVVLVDGHTEGTIAFADLDGDPGVDEAWRTVGPDELAVIVYTSGTTGTPKGVELTHRAVLGNTQGLNHAIGTAEGTRFVSYLPMAHIAERQLSHYRPMALGMEVTTCPDPRAMPEHLLAVRPHYFFGPPRMLAKFRAAAADLDEPILKHFGLDEALVALTGSAPVPAELSKFWLEAGLPLVEGWGLTECGAFGAFGRLGSQKPGTIGPALPGIDLRIADDGEIMVRSPWLMRGYRNLPEATAEAFEDGWLHSGDIGELDDDGQLRVIDRKKEIIITAGGKNMSPAHIESRIKESGPLIGEACVIGNDRPFNVALIVVEPAAAALADGDLTAAVAGAVDRANERLARVEQVKYFHVLTEPWLPGGDEVTPTMKLKRKAIAEKHAAIIDALYDDATT